MLAPGATYGSSIYNFFAGQSGFRIIPLKDKFYVVIWFLIPLVVYKFLVPKDVTYIGEHPVDRDPQLLLWETTELDQNPKMLFQTRT